MEEIKITLVNAEISTLKLTKNDVVIIQIPGSRYRKIGASNLGFKPLGDAFRRAFPDTGLLILPQDVKLSIIEKDEALKLKKKA